LIDYGEVEIAVVIKTCTFKPLCTGTVGDVLILL